MSQAELHKYELSLLKNKYFQTLIDLKYQEFYIKLYLDRSHAVDVGISIYSAIMASASIGGWALWNNPDLHRLWLVLLGSSQIINAAKPFLPYKKHIKNVPKYLASVMNIFNEYDSHWLSIATDECSHNVINEYLKAMRDEISLIETQYVININMQRNRKISKLADQELKEYIESFYPGMIKE